MIVRIDFFSPCRLLIGGFVLWLLLRLSIGFMTYESAANPEVAMLVMGLYVGAFMLGTYAGGRPDRRDTQSPPLRSQVKRLRRVTFVLLLIGLGFLVLRFYDVLYVRGLLEAEDIQQFRSAQNTVVGDSREVHGVSFISGIGYPLGVPLLVLTIAFRRYLGTWQALAGYALFALYTFYVVLSGNRYILIGPLVLAAIAWTNAHGAFRLDRRGVAVLLAGFVTLQVFVASGSARRDELFGVDSHLEALNVAPDRRLFSASPTFLEWYAHQPVLIQDIIYGHIGFAWYLTHGMYEFPKVWAYADSDGKSWGGFQFSGATYFLRLVGFDMPSDEIWRRNLPTYGFYTTFFGPVYVDFGVAFGVVYCAALGALAQWTWVLMRRGRVSGLFLYPVASSVIINMPVCNMIDAGLGVPILALSAASALVVRLGVRGHPKTSWITPVTAVDSPTRPAERVPHLLARSSASSGVRS